MTTTDQVLPWMELKSDGTIDIAWYDRRNDPADLLWDVYFSTSTDGGQTFQPNVRVSSVSFQTPRTTQGLWFGEYLGLATNNQKTYIAFTSSFVDPMGDIFFSRLNNPSIGVPEYHSDFTVNIYPNPCHDELNIVLTDCAMNKMFVIELYAASGQLIVFREYPNSNQAIIDLSAFVKGVYVLKLTYGNDVQFKKIVKL